VRALLFTVLARVRGFLRPDDPDRDLEAELVEHLRMAEDAKVRHGMSREAARREARLELGGLTQLREEGRDARGLPWLSGAWLDVKLGGRLLAKYPGLTLVSTVALAIGIAIVAGFHAGTNFFVNPSLPVPDGDRVVAIWNYDVGAGDRGSQTVGDMLALRAELRSVDDVGRTGHSTPCSRRRPASRRSGIARRSWRTPIRPGRVASSRRSGPTCQ
jgi:hypothetical protein